MSSFSSNQGQTSRPRAKSKPILRKLTQSERNSLDLDRPAEEDGFSAAYGGRSSQEQGGNGSAGGNGRNPRGYHRRNASGTSQFSTDSGQRAGSFIHPFAQTPYARPFTPPVAASYQTSLHESEHSTNLVPTPTEDEEQDHEHEPRRAFRSTSNLSQRATSSVNSSVNPTATTQPLLRIQTKQSQLASRLALATSNTSVNNYLSPRSPDLPSAIDTSTSTPASNMRSSIENFRIRSHSHQDSGSSRQFESIAEARRRFEEAERARDEKAAQEEVRKLEKRNEKEARKIEREHRRSSVSEGARTKRSKSDLTMQSEKGGFFTGPVQDTNGLAASSSPGSGSRQRSATFTAKKKTHSTWTKFMMWFRTRLLRMGNKKN